MCGRFTLSKPVRAVADLFRLAEPPAELRPRYNVAPSQLIAVVGLKPDGRTRGLAQLRWGFVSRHSDTPNPKVRPINAKAESVAYREPFRESFRDRRCLVPTDGFYEWSSRDGAKAAYHFRPPGNELMAFAGVWDRWDGPGGPILSCAILTVAAVAPVKEYHDRMPLILPPDRWDAWLDPASKVADLMPLLSPPPPGYLEAVRVGSAVNSPRNDGPECLAPAA
jgi:putative SOS response-associated peptidase YedK